MRFEFVAPARTVFGWGRRAEIGSLAAPLGRRAILVTGSRTLERSGVIDEIVSLLSQARAPTERLAAISREPEVADVDEAAARLRQLGPRDGDFVLAFGGGSAIDLAKAVAAMATNSQGPSVRDYLEGVGRGLKLAQPPLPILAVPTTAGTGSEATRNAVISSFDPPFKKSLRHDGLMPAAVLIDPELTVSLPAEVTAHTGMDAITQLIESYASCRAQPIPRALALQGLRLAATAIVPAVRAARSSEPAREAREAMALAAYLSGMALANSGLGLAHGVAAALGVHCRVPHGLACAVMLPAALRVNRTLCERELAELAVVCHSQRSQESLGGAREALRCAPGDTAAAADALVGWVERLGDELGIPRRLSEIGVCREQLPALVRDSRGNSMSGNPRQLSDDELHRLLEGML
jgi:alcohol dehydrogenase class IV